jgi:Domain of unknown function (DUF4304)
MKHEPTQAAKGDMMKALYELDQVGFKRSNKRWFQMSDDTIVVVDLQRSNFSAFYYINVAVWLLTLGLPPSIPPREEQCHLRTRIKDPSTIGALDLEEAMDPDERQHLIKRMVLESVLPLAKQCRTIAGCRDAVAEQKFEAITLVARDVLGVNWV